MENRDSLIARSRRTTLEIDVAKKQDDVFSVAKKEMFMRQVKHNASMMFGLGKLKDFLIPTLLIAARNSEMRQENEDQIRKEGQLQEKMSQAGFIFGPRFRGSEKINRKSTSTLSCFFLRFLFSRFGGGRKSHKGSQGDGVCPSKPS